MRPIFHGLMVALMLYRATSLFLKGLLPWTQTTERAGNGDIVLTVKRDDVDADFLAVHQRVPDGHVIVAGVVQGVSYGQLTGVKGPYDELVSLIQEVLSQTQGLDAIAKDIHVDITKASGDKILFEAKIPVHGVFQGFDQHLQEIVSAWEAQMNKYFLMADNMLLSSMRIYGCYQVRMRESTKQTQQITAISATNPITNTTIGTTTIDCDPCTDHEAFNSMVCNSRMCNGCLWEWCLSQCKRLRLMFPSCCCQHSFLELSPGTSSE